MKKLVMLVVPLLAAQAQSKFEVVSVKPCAGGENTVVGAGRGASPGGAATPGRLDLNCRTVMSLIETAYTSGAPPLPPVEGGPDWIRKERYTIDAKAEGTPSGADMRGPMLRSLLADRFQLKTHIETREVAAYALTVAKGGPKLTPHREGSCVDVGFVKPITGPPPPHTPGERPVVCGLNHSGKGTGTNIVLDVAGVTLDYFARTFLGIAFADRPTINRTGIEGLFDIHLEFVTEEADDAGPTIFAALQQQLGLKLEQTKAPREFLLIDRVERPSEN